MTVYSQITKTNMDTLGTMREIQMTLFKANHVLLVPHRQPDSDSLGSACAFSRYLDDANIPNTLYCTTSVSKHYQFLDGFERLKKSIPPEIDTICIFDSGDARYAGLPSITRSLKARPVIINIDHHVSNEMYGDINLVITNSPSTSAVITKYFNFLRYTIDPEMATCLLSGLLTDTGMLSNPSTNKVAFETASQLLSSGARIESVTNSLERIKPISSLKLWGRALSRLQKHPDYDFAWSVITQDDYIECNAKPEDAAGLSNFLNTLSDCSATLILKEIEGGYIKGSLRTTFTHVDVSRIAMALSGGGHKRAAGFTIKGRLKKTEDGWRIV